MRNVYYLTKRNIALNNYESLCDLIIYQINYQYQNGDGNFIQNLRPPLLQNHSEIITSSSSTNNYALYKNAVAGKELLFLYLVLLKEVLLLMLKNHHVGVYLLIKVGNTNVISEKTTALVSKW